MNKKSTRKNEGEMYTNYSELLRIKGLKATTKRVQILELLCKNHKLLSVQGMRDLLMRDGVTFDKVTLYRMMQDFARVGIVRQVDLRRGHALYEIMPGVNASTHTHHDHHHIVCTQCGTIEAINKCFLHKSIDEAITKSKKFAKAYDHTFEIFAICTSCSKKTV